MPTSSTRTHDADLIAELVRIEEELLASVHNALQSFRTARTAAFAEETASYKAIEADLGEKMNALYAQAEKIEEADARKAIADEGAASQ